MLIYVIETGIAIFYLVSLWQAYWPQLQEQQAYEREQREQYNKIIDGKSESINSIVH